MKTRLIVLGVLVLAVGGCAATDGLYRGIYQGLQIREELVNPSAGPGKDRPLTYSEYAAERQRILDQPPGK